MPYGAKPQCMESTSRSISCETKVVMSPCKLFLELGLIRTVGQGPFWQQNITICCFSRFTITLHLPKKTLFLYISL